MPGALRADGTANRGAGAGEGMQRSWGLISNRWVEGQLRLAKLRTVHFLPPLIWAAAITNVHSALSQTNEGKLLPRSTTATGGLPF